MKKIVNNLNFLKSIFYKVYFDTIILSLQNKNRKIIVESMIDKFEDWIELLNHCSSSNLEIEKIKLSVLNEITNLITQKEVDVYLMWDIQNKIDMIINTGSIQWKK